MRVFARVEGAQVSGYGFFLGGGRPQGVAWAARMGESPIAQGVTDTEGGFAFVAPVPVSAPVTVLLDTGEGHMATATLPPERFGASQPPAIPAQSQSGAAPATAANAPAPEDLAPAEVAALVEAAVARQVAPLQERIAQLDARLRFVDLLSGVFLILGLAGMALWARGRRP